MNLPLLIFDGDCGFCTSTAKWAEKHLHGAADAVPWQRLDWPRFGLNAEEAASAAWWIDAGGKAHRGHRAVGRALLAVGGAWRWLGWLCLVPPFSWFSAVVYKLITRFRYRLPGGTPACR